MRSKDQLGRIDALRIPPAWRDVHIAVNARSPIQAWGFDARGRKQYRYHARAVEKGQLSKHYRVRLLGRDLPRLKRKLDRDFKREGLPKERVCAGIVLLISDAFFRVGSDRYERENSTYGITTLRKSHVEVVGEDAVRFEYLGKRSIRQWQFLQWVEMTEFVKELLKTPGQRLFRYREGRKWRNVDARDINDYIEEIAGFPYTAKDFRTWGGTLRMATVLADLGGAPNEQARKKTVATAVRLVAAELGNTPAICRKSYVHPVLISRYLKNGSTILVRHRGTTSKKGSFTHSPEEKALIAFLAQHFPERRRERRTD